MGDAYVTALEQAVKTLARHVADCEYYADNAPHYERESDCALVLHSTPQEGWCPSCRDHAALAAVEAARSLPAPVANGVVEAAVELAEALVKWDDRGGAWFPNALNTALDAYRAALKAQTEAVKGGPK